MFYKTITLPFSTGLDNELNLLLIAQEDKLKSIHVSNAPHQEAILKQSLLNENLPVFTQAENELRQYFEGTKKVIQLDFELEGTPFQKKVWKTLSQVSYGQTYSYQAFAKMVAPFGATRAVATAIAKNPLLFLLPCHRVIGSDGSLRGYAGGLELKRGLLALEKKVTQQERDD